LYALIEGRSADPPALLSSCSQLAGWIRGTADSLYDERQLELVEGIAYRDRAGAFRSQAIIERIGDERVFELGTTQRNKLAGYKLATKPEPLTDDSASPLSLSLAVVAQLSC